MSYEPEIADFTEGCMATSPDGVVWRVLAITEEAIQFYGPGPCRSLKVVSKEELSGWAPIVPA